MSECLNELLTVANITELRETGGGHNQKGVDYQRHWAIMRMFELEEDEEKDFLVLFEAIQDVAILNSATEPTAICIYQIKKKDRKEWGWRDLTGLNLPPTKGTGRQKKLEVVKDSPLGKLYAAVRAMKSLQASGRFVSNAGCDLELADGANAATSLPSALSTLSIPHLELLIKALETMHAAGESPPELTRLHVERADLPAHDTNTHLVGIVHKFLLSHSPEHAGQAQSFVDSLMGVVGPLGAKTDACKTFEEMRKERGYSAGEFRSSLQKLKTVPDLMKHFDAWLTQLTNEGMSIFDVTQIRVAATGIYKRLLKGASEDDLSRACDGWMATHPNDLAKLRPFFDAAYEDLKDKFPTTRKPEIFAAFAIRAIKQCVDLT